MPKVIKTNAECHFKTFIISVFPNAVVTGKENMEGVSVIPDEVESGSRDINQVFTEKPELASLARLMICYFFADIIIINVDINGTKHEASGDKHINISPISFMPGRGRIRKITELKPNKYDIETLRVLISLGLKHYFLDEKSDCRLPCSPKRGDRVLDRSEITAVDLDPDPNPPLLPSSPDPSATPGDPTGDHPTPPGEPWEDDDLDIDKIDPPPAPADPAPADPAPADPESDPDKNKK